MKKKSSQFRAWFEGLMAIARQIDEAKDSLKPGEWIEATSDLRAQWLEGLLRPPRPARQRRLF